MRIAMLSDTHFNLHNKHNKNINMINNTFSYFKEICIGLKVDKIIHLGDLFDTKDVIITESLLSSNNIIDELSEIVPVDIISGNHDLASLNDEVVSLVNNYKNKKEIYPYTSYSTTMSDDSVFHFVPYSKNISDVIEKIKLNKKKKNYLFGHFGITDFKPHIHASKKAMEESGVINKKVFSEFTHCFLGHYHGYQHIDNITYVSSPYQMKHGDELDKHGFVILDTSDNSIEFIENKWSEQFLTIELNKKTLKDISSMSGMHVRLVLKKEINDAVLYKIKNEVLKKNLSLTIKKDYIDKIITPVIEGWDDIVYQTDENVFDTYFEKRKNDLPCDKNELMEILNNVAKGKI